MRLDFLLELDELNGENKIASPFNLVTMLKYKTYSFETLEVWKEARKLVVKIYKITSRFPSEEKYGLVSQMRRAALSIPTNIAEGSSRESLRDQARYSEISFGSLMELVNQSILCFDLQFITELELGELRVIYDSIGSKLNGLRDSQLKRYRIKIQMKAKSYSKKPTNAKSLSTSNPITHNPISL